MFLRCFQPFANQFFDLGRRLAAFLGFLLKHVQDVNKFAETHSINSTESVALVACTNLDDTRTAETMQNFGVERQLSLLSFSNGKTHGSADCFGERSEIFL